MQLNSSAVFSRFSCSATSTVFSVKQLGKQSAHRTDLSHNNAGVEGPNICQVRHKTCLLSFLQHPKDSTFHAGREICYECCSPGGSEKCALQKIKRRESESTSFIKQLDWASKSDLPSPCHYCHDGSAGSTFICHFHHAVSQDTQVLHWMHPSAAGSQPAFWHISNP